MNQTSDEDRLVEKVKSIREWITRGWEIKEKEEKIFRGMFVLGSDDFEKLGAKAHTGKNQTNDEDRAEQKQKYIRGWKYNEVESGRRRVQAERYRKSRKRLLAENYKTILENHWQRFVLKKRAKWTNDEKNIKTKNRKGELEDERRRVQGDRDQEKGEGVVWRNF